MLHLQTHFFSFTVNRKPVGIFVIGKISVYKHSFCYTNMPTTGTKELFVSTANRTLVISIGDVSDIFAIAVISGFDMQTRLVGHSVWYRMLVTHWRRLRDT